MNNDRNYRKKIDRRDFLKIIGLSSTAILTSCAGASDSSQLKGADSGRKQGEMTYRTNASTGDRVSILGYGMMRLPTLPDDKTGADGNNIDQQAVNQLVDHALEHGVNYFDTSPAYCKGFSEKATGIALARHPRDTYFIATKLSNFSPSTWSREKSLEMYEKSFKELQTDYIDYLLLHGIGMGGMEAFNGRYVDNGVLDTLIEDRETGRIRNLGFSYHGDVAVFDHLLKLHDEGKVKWDFAQIQMNYIDWKHAKQINERNTDASYLYDELDKRGIAVVIMEPLLGGRLASVPNNLMSMMKQRRPDDSVASWAFRYAGTPERILTVLSGMTYMEHLEDNIKTYSPLDLITDDENAFLEKIATLMLEFPTVPCTDCKYCMPCPYGVDIPSIFAHYNECINEDRIETDNRSPEYARARRAFLVGYDRSVPRLRQASHCIGCGTCQSHCPQDIKIPERLHKIDEYVESLRRNS